MLTDAGSVDGEWNSGRLLPELTQHGAGALTSSKYFGKGGMDALMAVLEHADRYGLKWVFVNEPYYEPLLVFSGWRRIEDVEDRTIAIWARDNVAPLLRSTRHSGLPHGRESCGAFFRLGAAFWRCSSYSFQTVAGLRVR